jgi:hypothetical protein
MEGVRESWTDERLDDLNTRVDRGFDRVDADIRELRTETKAGFDRVDRRFEEMHQLLLRFCGLMIAALVGLIAPLIGVVATQL